jgi:hypothetical protein
MSAMLLWSYRGVREVCRGGRASESGEAGKSRGLAGAQLGAPR